MPIRRPLEVVEHSKPNPPTNEVAIEKLFFGGRVRQGAPLLHKMLFLAYLPFGVVLVVARALLFMLMSLLIIVLPRSVGDIINPVLLRLICGLIVYHNHNGKKRLSDAPYVLACNHVSDFDTFAMWLATPRWSCVTSAHLKSIPIMGSVYSALDAIFVAPNPESRELTKQEIKKKLDKNAAPVLIFPEGGLTSGKTGTLMYHKFVFSLGCGIVPGCIKMNDPWPVEHDYLGSSWGKNFFWFLLVPFHVFEITFLPVENIREEEAPEDFARRVQHITCDYLGIAATSHTYSQKKELVRQLKEKQKQESAKKSE